ncbi:hypothetical protein [Bdellovibrio bacteriovorus]|uniref:hypothetical protein n=1 Tax=Bdellovibrio TaxID=958 RepID=UPI0035A96F3A
MKILLYLVLFFGASSALAQTTLTVGVPFGITRNQAILQYYQFLSDVLKEAGFKTELKKISGVLPYEALVRGEVDSIAYDDLALTTDREKVITISFPISFVDVHVFYLAENKKFNEKNLKKYRGALVLNNSMIEKEAKARRLKYVTTINPYHNAQLLIDKKVDYFLSIEEVGKSALVSTPNGTKKVKMSESIFATFPLYFSMQKKYKKDLSRIEAAFKRRLEGDLSAYPLVKKVLNKKPEFPEN